MTMTKLAELRAELCKVADGAAFFGMHDSGCSMEHLVGSVAEAADALEIEGYPSISEEECRTLALAALLAAGCDAVIDEGGTLRSYGSMEP